MSEEQKKIGSAAAVPCVSAPFHPIALGCGFGLLHPASGRTGVLMCGPWGLDELCARKTWRGIAAELAAAGFPALRFDYPGTGDALDIGPDGGLESWIAASAAGGDRLKAIAGCDRLVLVGLGVGATVALRLASGRDDIVGLVLAAPVVSGRRFLRETALRAAVIDESLGLSSHQRPAGLSIGGLVLAEAVAADLGRVNLVKADPGAPRPALVVARPDQPQDEALANHLDHAGWSVARLPFAGYDALMDNPTLSMMPRDVVRGIVGWIGASFATEGCNRAVAPTPLQSALLTGRGFEEEALVFGPGLFGILTRPERGAASMTVVLLNSGYDHHVGWARMSVRTARALAAAGVATLRFDMANIGDSPPKPGAPEQVLYSEGQIDDVVSALDMLAERGLTPALLVGRCSGAYVAFQTAARESRVAGIVLINPLRFVWDPDEEVDQAIRSGPRPLSDYRRRALSAKTLRRLLAGDVDVIGAVRGLATHVLRRCAGVVAPLLGDLSKQTRLLRRSRDLFTALRQRSVPIRIVCSADDGSLEQVAFHLGAKGTDVYPNISLTVVPDADHNMTPEPAQQRVIEIVVATARALASQPAAAAE